MNTLLNLDRVFYKPDNITFVGNKSINEFILNDISLHLEKGKTLGIVGESGSGKTTLAKLIAGVFKATKGNISYNFEKNNKGRNSQIQILFQNTNEIINPSRKISNLLKDSFENEVKLKEICDLLDIKKELFDKYGYQLSGGERQRVALARILSVNPQLLILDEPFTAQDPDSQASFRDIFLKIKAGLDISIICITHDIYLLNELADEIVVLFGGQIMEKGNVEKILNSYRHPYTKQLINALNYKLKRPDITTDIIKADIKTCCSFYYRCDRKSNTCLTSVEKKESSGLFTNCNNPL